VRNCFHTFIAFIPSFEFLFEFPCGHFCCPLLRSQCRSCRAYHHMPVPANQSVVPPLKCQRFARDRNRIPPFDTHIDRFHFDLVFRNSLFLERKTFTFGIFDYMLQIPKLTAIIIFFVNASFYIGGTYLISSAVLPNRARRDASRTLTGQLLIPPGSCQDWGCGKL